MLQIEEKSYSIRTFRNKLVITLFFGILGFSQYAFTQVKSPDRIIGEYSGETKNNLAHGKGKAQGFDTYEGEFKKGRPHGEGTYYFRSDVRQNDFSYKTGDIYKGGFVKGKFNGQGTITFADTSNPDLVGYWMEGKFIGRTKKGYEIISKSGGIDRIVCYHNGTAVNKVYIKGLMDIREMGPMNIEFMNGVYHDLPTSKFPLWVDVSGSFPKTRAKAEFKVLLEKPGDWVIEVVSNL